MNQTPETKEQSDSSVSRSKHSRTAKTAIVAVVALVAVAAIVLLLWLLVPRGNSGRPVPAPRTVGPDQTATQTANAPGETTITISPEEAQRAGIRIETVGERISTEATGQQTTGVVQTNAYRETPVMALVSGIGRSVGP